MITVSYTARHYILYACGWRSVYHRVYPVIGGGFCRSWWLRLASLPVHQPGKLGVVGVDHDAADVDILLHLVAVLLAVLTGCAPLSELGLFVGFLYVGHTRRVRRVYYFLGFLY